MVEEDSEKKENKNLTSLMLIEKLGKEEKISLRKDFKKVALGDFCITPKCKKCTSNARKCVHRKNR
jgi:hypothetical protein